MDAAAFQALRDSQREHWWFRGRRNIVRELIANGMNVPENAAILEAGCGYGGNLDMLGEFGHVRAFEFSKSALHHVEQTTSHEVAWGELPENIGYGENQFDVIALLDVLEHIRDDVTTLARLGERLTSTGQILLTVPALPWLWSEHDVLHHHHRRYTKKLLSRRIEDAGLEIRKIGYFNSFLFPLAVAQRGLAKWGLATDADKDMPSPWLNLMLANIFSKERKVINHVPLPIGLSLFAVVSKKQVTACT